MHVRPGPVGPVYGAHVDATRRDATLRCMFQEVCPGAMVMHSGVVVGPVSSNFAYPAFIRSWPGGFICIRNSPDKNFRSSISLYFSGRETTECVLQLRDSKGDGISFRKRKGGWLKKSILEFGPLFIVDFVNSRYRDEKTGQMCLFANLNQLKK